MNQKLKLRENLTIKYILERITQEEIMEYYLNIPVNSSTLQSNSFLSPFRIDNEPTCNYYYIIDRFRNKKLKINDWNGTFNGDVFDVASWATKIKTNTSQGFILLLHKICYDFNIYIYNNNEERDKLNYTLQEYHTNISIKTFTIIPRKWNEYDKRYWYDKYRIGKDLLKIGKVLPVQEIYIEGEINKKVYKYFSKDPAYAYYGGIKNGIKIWNIYFPFRKKGERRFMTNYRFIQGLDSFQPARIGIITKSLKDVLCYKRFGIQAIAVASETHLLTPDEIFDIKNRCDIIITNFDYDKTGIRLANKYKKKYGILPLMFTRGKHNQIDFGVKDFSEFIENFGDEATKKLINNILNIHKEDLDNFNKHIYNLQFHEYRYYK